MQRAIALRHVAFEDLGCLAPLLSARGYSVEYLELPDRPSLAPALEADLLVVLGGPIGAYEEDAYPFLKDELRVIEQRLSADLPTLGICLGAQLMARALGARVYPGGQKEIGWSPLRLTDAGTASCLRAFADGAPVLHWHGDTFDLPAGATLLASTQLYENQAFSWQRRALGLQFHAEVVRAEVLERWFVGHACELAGAGITIPQLRADTRRSAAELGTLATRCFEDWLNALA